MKGWYLALLKWSKAFGRPYYSSSLVEYEELEGTTRVIDSSRSQVEGAPRGRVYFGSSIEDFQNAEKHAYINLDKNYTGKPLMSESEYAEASKQLTDARKAKQTAQAKTK
jgi:hypothetical protein